MPHFTDKEIESRARPCIQEVLGFQPQDLLTSEPPWRHPLLCPVPPCRSTTPGPLAPSVLGPGLWLLSAGTTEGELSRPLACPLSAFSARWSGEWLLIWGLDGAGSSPIGDTGWKPCMCPQPGLLHSGVPEGRAPRTHKTETRQVIMGTHAGSHGKAAVGF